MTVLHIYEDLTSEWLTSILREKGVLGQGHITRIETLRTSHQASLNYFISLTYSSDAPETAPRTLFLKLSRPERLPLTASEVEYYTKILAQTPFQVAPVCYSAEYDAASGAYHILMEDVSQTHSGLSLSYPPKPEDALQMAATLASLHAHWWDSPALNTVSDVPTSGVIARYIDFCLAGLRPMLDFVAGRLTTEQHLLVEQLAKQWPRWMEARIRQNPHHLTLIHGDCHNANFLLPKAGGQAYLVDRQPFEWSLTCWLGASDLSYMMVHWWYPTYRQRVEESVLRAYHNQLLACGVTNYDWQQLWDDYCLCAIQSLYVPLAWCAEGSVENTSWIWIPQLLYTLDAIQHLQSVERLERSI